MSEPDDFVELARGAPTRAPHGIVAGLAAEVVFDGPPPRAVRCSCLQGEPELHASVREFLERAGAQNTGPGLERKLRPVRFGRRGDDFEVVFAPTTWELGRAFHMAVMARREPIVAAPSWLQRTFAGEPITPGLAAVHGVVVTSDMKLVLMRRSAAVLYRPLHWAATFEEQMVAADLSREDALDVAVRRGVHEELGITERDAQVEFLTTMIELETLNIAFLSLVKLGASSRDVVELAAHAPDAHDADRLHFVDADPAVLRSLVERRGEPNLAPLHPTSALRMSALARHLESARP